MRKTTLIVLGAFVVLLGWVLATREPRVSVGVHTLAPPKLDKARVTGLELSGARAAVLRKHEGRWFVSAPGTPDVRYPADAALVEGALDALAELRKPDFVSDRPERQAEYEVDDAKGLRLAVLQEGGPALKWVLGKASRNGGVYVRAQDSADIFAHRGRLDWSVRRDVKDWRQRRVVELEVDLVSRLVLRSKEGQVLALRKEGSGPGRWSLPEGTPVPPGFRFDARAPERLVQQLASLRAQDFADGDAAKDSATGLGGAHDSVEVELVGGRKVVLRLGPSQEGTGTVAARVDGDAQVYLLPAASVEPLRKRLTDLRDLGLLTFEPAEVTTVKLQAGAKRVTAVKEGGTWRLTEPKKLPDGFDFAPEQVDAQLAWLHGLSAARLVEGAVTDAAAGFASPSALVELAVGGAPAGWLRLGKAVPGATEGLVYARSSVDGFTYAVPESVRGRLAQGVELFKRRAPPSFAGGGPQGLDSLPPELRRQIEAQLRAASH